MSWRAALVTFPFVIALTSCRTIEITTSPENAVEYHGSWRGPSAELDLVPGKTLSSGRFVSHGIAATIRYRHSQGLMQCEWKGLSGRHLVSECGNRAPERIRVDIVPHREDGVWTMMVEGAELTRK